MTISSALYYPHTALTDKSLIKNSLFLWDKVEYITPEKRWKHSSLNSKLYDEAIELIAQPHFPSDSERKEVHLRVTKLLEEKLPDSFFLGQPEDKNQENTYPIYPQKLDHVTWKMLEEHKLVRMDSIDNDYHGTNFWGLKLMSMLADVCAGELKRKITDRHEAYTWLQKCSVAGTLSHSEIDSSIKESSARNSLVSLSINLLNTDDIPLRTLIAMRKREAKSSTQDYSQLRRNYLTKVDKYVEELTSKQWKESDVIEIKKNFETDLNNDLNMLRDELNLLKRKSLLSKEVLVSATTAFQAIGNPIVSLEAFSTMFSFASLAALASLGIQYKAGSKSTLGKNSMSWLYLANKHAKRFDPRRIII